MVDQKTTLNVVLGCMSIGEEGKDGARLTTPADIEEVLGAFAAHGHAELDCARSYTGGTSEAQLGRLDLAKKGLVVHTKLYPTSQLKQIAHLLPPEHRISHTPEDLRKHLDISLKTLNTDCIELWYLHGPDRSVPYEVTLKAVNDLHKEGKFKRLGLSNYMSWEVAEIVGICRANGYIQPTVFEGPCNAIYRAVEPELLPCLHKFGISFYAFNALAGGFFTGRYTGIDDVPVSNSHFDEKRHQGKAYRAGYWNEPYFNALAAIKSVGEKHGLTLSEIGLRWLTNHSQLKREHGDSIIIGASRHIEQNLLDLEKGPLPEDVLQVLDDSWKGVMPYAAKYYQ